jgi:hypothetical protein
MGSETEVSVPIPYIGKRFDPDGFKAYLKTVQFTSFRPEYVVLHHTAIPSLKDRPNGFTEASLQSLLNYYSKELGWSAAPHLFVDDREDGIVVFQRLDRRGIHAASFNGKSWGLEMLGHYDIEDFHSGRGAKVRDMSMQALALMCEHLGVEADTIKFHRDDPKTKKTCPGLRVQKSDVHARVRALLKGPEPVDEDVTVPAPGWRLMLPSGLEHLPVHVVDGRPTVRIRDCCEALAPGGKYALSKDRSAVTWTVGGRAHQLTVAELDETGKSWTFVRDYAKAGYRLDVAGKVLTLSAAQA